ncbi:MAG TPA: peptide MFS transporter [Longimicrobiaceae bacterium]|nr:peptide MFS transporter [Longimicrobiaceae bacterium]
MPKDPTSEFSSEPASTVAGSQSTAAAGADRSFFGHPRGLATLFFTEMWERFSYYGMRALLILFMTASIAEGGLGFDVARAGAIYGLYTAFVYMLALPGGWVADRIIGQRRAVLYGGIIIAAGHFSMAIESISTFYLGLILIVLGTGLLKPNISSMVGELYREEESARRDAGFSIFYMGINLGAFIAPLVCGWLGQQVDWHLGFAAAGVGMVLGLIQYVFTGKYLGQAGLGADNEGPADARRHARKLWAGLAAAAIAAFLIFFVFGISIQAVAAAGTYMIVGLTAIYFAYIFAVGGMNTAEKKRVAVIGILFAAAAVFWAGFEQHGSSFNLVAEQLTDTELLGIDFPSTWFQSLNPLYIITFAGFFAWLWVALSHRNLEPSSPLKFGVGLMLLGAGFAVMIPAMALAAQGALISPWWLILAFFLHTMGELTLSPVGLSTVTKLAPRRMVGQMMGIWFMASALGNLIAGLLAGAIGAGAAAPDGQISAAATGDVFTTVMIVALTAGVTLAIFSKPIQSRLMGGVH